MSSGHTTRRLIWCVAARPPVSPAGPRTVRAPVCCRAFPLQGTCVTALGSPPPLRFVESQDQPLGADEPWDNLWPVVRLPSFHAASDCRHAYTSRGSRARVTVTPLANVPPHRYPNDHFAATQGDTNPPATENLSPVWSDSRDFGSGSETDFDTSEQSDRPLPSYAEVGRRPPSDAHGVSEGNNRLQTHQCIKREHSQDRMAQSGQMGGGRFQEEKFAVGASLVGLTTSSLRALRPRFSFLGLPPHATLYASTHAATPPCG